MDFSNVIPGVVIGCYILIELCKATFLKSSNNRKHIPLISAIIGVIAGLVIFFLKPDLLGCENILEAIAIGGMSGFAATGCNQLIKKYFSSGEDSSSETDGY